MSAPKARHMGHSASDASEETEPGEGRSVASDGGVNALVTANRALTALGYVMYPVLLVLLGLFDQGMLVRCICVPAAGFVVVSAFRYVYDAPRPYELGGPMPPTGKRTKGKSFPSRHTFCMFTIACAWAVWQPVVGAVLLACGCFMACVRVRLGVHFPRDVVAGALCAIVFAIIGYGLIPWTA